MNREELEQIAQRPSCCKPFGASVTLSVGERDELVAMARDGMRYRLLRQGTYWSVIDGGGDTLRAECLDDALDARMAKEEA